MYQTGGAHVFWLGMVVGSTVGVAVMCLMQVAGADDKE